MGVTVGSRSVAMEIRRRCHGNRVAASFPPSPFFFSHVSLRRSIPSNLKQRFRATSSLSSSLSSSSLRRWRCDNHCHNNNIRRSRMNVRERRRRRRVWSGYRFPWQRYGADLVSIVTKEDGNDDVIINYTLYVKKTTSSNNNINSNNVPLFPSCSVIITYIID